MHSYRSAFTSAAIAGIAALQFAGPVAAQDIDTTGGTEASCCAAAIYKNPLEFSEGWGQSFIAGGVRLVSFSFVLREAEFSAAATFKASVYKWDGVAPSGPVLFISSLRSAQTGVWTETFSTNIEVQQGDAYVALINAMSTNTFMYMPILFDDYAGGSLVHKFTFMSDPPLYFSGSDFVETYDAAFTATFNAATVTPEPVSMMLAATGLAGIAAARRRHRQRP